MKEYAIESVEKYKHWSCSYPNLKIVRQSAKQLGYPVKILKRIPRTAGHEFGARWEIIEYQNM